MCGRWIVLLGGSPWSQVQAEHHTSTKVQGPHFDEGT